MRAGTWGGGNAPPPLAGTQGRTAPGKTKRMLPTRSSNRRAQCLLKGAEARPHENPPVMRSAALFTNARTREPRGRGINVVHPDDGVSLSPGKK